MTKDAAFAPEESGESLEDKHWRRNLAVCLAGSFTTIVAMTLLLPFLPQKAGDAGTNSLL